MNGILVYFKPRTLTLETEEVRDKDAYYIIKRVLGKFIAPTRRTRKGVVVEAEQGMAFFFENPLYFYEVVAPSLHADQRFLRKFLSPNLQDVTSVLSRDEKWMIFGPFLHTTRIYDLFHLARVEIPREYWEDRTHKFLTSLVQRSKKFGFYEFEIAISPILFEETDIYKYPEICTEELEYCIYYLEPLIISFFVVIDSTLVYVEEDSAEQIFELAEDPRELEEYIRSGRKLSLNFVEKKLEQFIGIKELNRFAEELFKMRCDVLMSL